MDVHRYPINVPIDALVADTRAIVERWDWRRGAFGHALSLPAASDLHPYARYRYHNFPCTGLLATAPALRALFESFQCEKVSFRLLRRPARSAYGWHTDEWKGTGVVRFQVPLISAAAAFLVTTDYARVEEILGDRGPLSAESFLAFAAANAGHFRKNQLAVGVLHYFDTTHVHTLVNGGPSERITVSFDLVANDWLRARYPAIAEELGQSAGRTLRRPGRLQLAAGWGGSRLFPLRTRLRRLLRDGASVAKSWIA
jgi:hypothetical protein